LVNIGWMAKISSAERKIVTVYRASVNRHAGATFGAGENSAVFPIEVIPYIRLRLRATRAATLLRKREDVL
jgi:hypothetical protein